MGFINPQLCGSSIITIPTNRAGHLWSMEPKYDGIRLIASKRDGDVRLYTRSGRDVTDNLPYIVEELELHPEDDFILDGELIYYAKRAGGGITADIGKVTAQTNANGYRFPGYYLSFVVFDVLMRKCLNVCGEKLATRRVHLDALLGKDGYEYISTALRLEPTQESADALVTLGFEGAVLKHEASLYVPGFRSPQWIKFKPQETADVVVTGFEDASDGKFAGQIGAMTFGLYESETLVEIGKCSGMNDLTRHDMTVNPEAYIGQVAEIAHHGVTKHGKFRHPQFRRIRDDKSADECTILAETRVTA